MKTKTILVTITAAILFGVMPLVANAANISWFSELYEVSGSASPGPSLYDSATSYLDLPISVVAADGSGCNESITSLSDSTMSTRAYFADPCTYADSGASFTGTFVSTMPLFTFDYTLDNTVGMTNLYVKDNGIEIYNNFLSAGSNQTVTLGITVGNTIEVGFGQGAYQSDTTLDYAMAVAPEPISSTLFIVGGATLGFRRFWKKRRNS